MPHGLRLPNKQVTIPLASLAYAPTRRVTLVALFIERCLSWNGTSCMQRRPQPKPYLTEYHTQNANED